MNSHNAQLAVTESAAPIGPHQPIDLQLPTGAEMIPFPTGRYAIPEDDMPDFDQVKAQERERIKFLLSLFAKMESGGIVAMSETLGFQLRAVPGYGASNLRNLYYKWKDTGWRGLMRKFTNGSEKLPADFIQHFRALCENNGRSMKQAMKKLYRAWDAGESIPGYGTWREHYATLYPERDLPPVCPGYPKGWSRSTLYEYQPLTATRKLKSRGFAAMKAELPSLVRDPGRLKPLQLVVIDDFEIDQLCYVHQWDVSGSRMIRAVCPMAGVVAMDVATRRILGMILKPRLPQKSGEEKKAKVTKQAITRAEVRLLLFGVIRDYGIPAHGMTILCEKAAAAVTAELQATFMNLFAGRVAITRTSTIDQSVLRSGFGDTGGKPWLKGWIESFFNLLHNIAAGELPGQKGAHYLVKPADLEEKLRVTQRLIGTGPRDAQLSDEQLGRARPPFRSPAELCDVYLQIFRWIEQRTDHELLGFDRVYEWRRNEEMAPWQPWEQLAELTSEEQTQVIPNDRPESPLERWAKLWPQVQCTKVDSATLMMLLLTPKKAEVKSRHLTFTHNKTGYTWAFDAQSPIAQIPQGSNVLVYFDPTRPDHAHVAHLDGRWLGEVRRWGGPTGKVDITDPVAITDAEREAAKLYGSLLSEVRSRPLHQAEEKKLAEDAAVNAALVAEAKHDRELGITATLNRTVPQSENVTTPTGERLASAIVESELQAAERRQRERKEAHEATQRELAASKRRAALTADDDETFLGGAGVPATVADEAPSEPAEESLEDYL